MSFCWHHGIREGADCDICEMKGSEMPVVESAPINAHANDSDAMAPSANVGGKPLLRPLPTAN
jgi:hypothetical protein